MKFAILYYYVVITKKKASKLRNRVSYVFGRCKHISPLQFWLCWIVDPGMAARIYSAMKFSAIFRDMLDNPELHNLLQLFHGDFDLCLSGILQTSPEIPYWRRIKFSPRVRGRKSLKGKSWFSSATCGWKSTFHTSYESLECPLLIAIW